MKLCCTKVTHWILALKIAVFVINGISAQDESTVPLCDEKRDPNCMLSSAENYLRRETLNELLRNLNDGDINFKYRSRKHIYPRFALYDANKQDIPQYPFARSWKNQLNQMSWNEASKLDKLQSRPKLSNYDKRGSANSFSSWGGKRDHNRGGDESSNNKREPAFSSWGGKRTQKFFNWGGKRSVDASDMIDTADFGTTYEHNIMKRSIDSPLNSSKHQDKHLCITDQMNLQELFKEFIDWSRKQPEQKKGSIYRKMLGVSTLHSPDNVSRRAGSFFQWGGKRSSKDFTTGK